MMVSPWSFSDQVDQSTYKPFGHFVSIRKFISIHFSAVLIVTCTHPGMANQS